MIIDLGSSYNWIHEAGLPEMRVLNELTPNIILEVRDQVIGLNVAGSLAETSYPFLAGSQMSSPGWKEP